MRISEIPPVPAWQFALYRTTTEAWDAMYEALQQAKKNIYWEVYIFADDRAGRRFIDLLVEKALQGVTVKLVVDRIGSRFLPVKTIRKLSDAGVKILFYNPVYFEARFMRWVMRLWQRNHRKVLVIDEEVAFLGGVNITFEATDWDDLHLKFIGSELVQPLVSNFELTFRFASRQVSKAAFKRSKRNPRMWSFQDIFFIALAPHRGSDRAFLHRFYLKAINNAQHKIVLFTPYFTPYKKFLSMLIKAVNRGVQVEIIAPLRSDHRFIDYMSYYFLELLERLGATIYLLPKMNHAKGFLIDDTAGLVGSSNFTHRSFFANAESDVFFKNSAMIAALKMAIEHWKERSAPVGESGQKKRRIRAGILNWIAQLFREYV